MNMGTEVVYSDDFCELTDEMLKIKKYFFPTLRAKFIQVRDIRVVYFEAQKDAKYAQRRTWGLAKNSVHWAADFSRSVKHSFMNFIQFFPQKVFRDFDK